MAVLRPQVLGEGSRRLVLDVVVARVARGDRDQRLHGRLHGELQLGRRRVVAQHLDRLGDRAGELVGVEHRPHLARPRPARSCLSNSTTVQPQAGRTSRTWSGAAPSLRISKSCCSFSPRGMVPKSWIGCGTTILGCGAAAGSWAKRAPPRRAVRRRPEWRFWRTADHLFWRSFCGCSADPRCYTARPRKASPRALPALDRLDPLDIYCIAIGGTGMAPLACLLQEEGHAVRGSDGPLYPPMSTLLGAAGIAPLAATTRAHLEPRPDLVVVGNAVPRTNPEALEVERLGLPRLSMPRGPGALLPRRPPAAGGGGHPRQDHHLGDGRLGLQRLRPRPRLPGRRPAPRPADQLPPRRRRALRHRGRRVQRRLLRPRPEVPPLPAADPDPDLGRVRPRRPLPDPEALRRAYAR